MEVKIRESLMFLDAVPDKRPLPENLDGLFLKFYLYRVPYSVGVGRPVHRRRRPSSMGTVEGQGGRAADEQVATSESVSAQQSVPVERGQQSVPVE